MGRLDGMEVVELRKPVKPKTVKTVKTLKTVKSTLTFKERERIMAKDILSNYEIARLLGVNESQASRLIKHIVKPELRRAGTLRIDLQGKLHTQDFCDYFKIKRR